MANGNALKPVKGVIRERGGGGAWGYWCFVRPDIDPALFQTSSICPTRILDLKWRNDEKHQSSENIFTQLHVNKCKETVPSYDFQEICIRQLHEVLKKNKSSDWICPTWDNSHFIGNNFAGLNFRDCQIVAKFKSRKKFTAKMSEIVCLWCTSHFLF